MGENKVNKKAIVIKKGRNNNLDIKSDGKETKYSIKETNIENSTKSSKTINYNSHLISEAIFLTTSDGSLIPTSSSLNPLGRAATLANNFPTTTATSVDSNTQQMKEEKNEAEAEGSDAAAPYRKPSAEQKSSANITSLSSQLVASTTNKEENLFTANFPFIATGIPSNFVTGFTSPNSFTAGLTPITTFSLQNPLLTPSLTIPIYNSLVAVSANTKDVILPTLNKDIFIPAVSASHKATTNKIKTAYSVITHNGTTMTTARGRKRTAQSRLPAKLKEPAAVARRNARERRRVKMVNDGFLRLRRHVPTDPKNKKLSKVKTLRLAIEYIHHLQQLLHADAAKQTGLVSTFSHVSTYEDIEGGTTWLHSDSLARVNREMEEDIFHTIDPARLRTNYTEYVSR